jgi:hypothetical protein
VVLVAVLLLLLLVVVVVIAVSKVAEGTERKASVNLTLSYHRNHCLTAAAVAAVVVTVAAEGNHRSNMVETLIPQ